MRVGSLEMQYLVFQSPINPKSRYIVGLAEMEPSLFRKLFDIQCAKAVGVNMEGEENKFFMIFLEDCMSPPITIIRSDDVNEALDRFVDETEWVQISDDEMDEDDSYYSYNGNGIRYDATNVRIYEVKLLSVHA